MRKLKTRLMLKFGQTLRLHHDCSPAKSETSQLSAVSEVGKATVLWRAAGGWVGRVGGGRGTRRDRGCSSCRSHGTTLPAHHTQTQLHRWEIKGREREGGRKISAVQSLAYTPQVQCWPVKLSQTPLPFQVRCHAILRLEGLERVIWWGRLMP